MTEFNSTTPQSIRQAYQVESQRLAGIAVGQIHTGLKEREAQREAHKINLSSVHNVARLREQTCALIEVTYPSTQASAIVGHLEQGVAQAINGRRNLISQYWLGILDQIEAGTLLSSLESDPVFQAQLNLAQTGARVRQRIEATYPAHAEQIIEGINQRLDDPSIPDTVEAIAQFYQGVLTQLEAGTLPETQGLPASSGFVLSEVEGFPASIPMDATQFWARIKGSGAPVQVGADFVDVFDSDGKYVARWLQSSNVLNYTPKAKPAAEWPPACPDCGGQMEVKRQGGTGMPFWSCRGFPIRCRGRAEFSPHPADAQSANGKQALHLSLERAQREGLMGQPKGRTRSRLTPMITDTRQRDRAILADYSRGSSKLFK